jgi:hypothetical protein
MKRLFLILFFTILLYPLSGRGQGNRNILNFYPLADSVCLYPELQQKLAIYCQKMVDSFYVTFIGYKEQKDIFIGAITKKPIVDPNKEISRTVLFDGVRPLLGTTSTWGYIFDRNNDGKIDYMALVGGAAAFKDENLNDKYPAKGKKPTLKQLEYFISHCKLIFNHWADDNYDGKIDAVVHIDMDPEHDWVERKIVAGSTKFDEKLDQVWAFHNDIILERENIKHTYSAVPYYPLGDKLNNITNETLIEMTSYLQLFNRASALCNAGKNYFRKE